MLDAIRSPLALCNFAEDDGALSEQLVDDAVLGGVFEVLERVLEGASTLWKIGSKARTTDLND